MSRLKPTRGTLLNRNHPLARGLAGCWPLNEGTGNKVFDLSGNGSTGTLVNDVTWTAGQLGTCLAFAGSDDRVVIPDDSLPPFGTGDFTIVIRCKHPRDAASRVLLSKGNYQVSGEFTFLKNSNDLLSFVGNSGSINTWSSISWPDDVWLQAAAIRKGTDLTVYQDGVAGTTDTSAGANLNTAISWRVGESGLAWDYAGEIDFVMIWYRALSTLELALLRREPFCMFERAMRPLSAADWVGIDSSHVIGGCGQDVGYELVDALDGAGYWKHSVNHTHWLIVDLGRTYNVQKVRARSNVGWDPLAVAVYASGIPDDWGAAIASGTPIGWHNTENWVETATTPKDGRYVLIVIYITEDGVNNYIGFGKPDPWMKIFDVFGHTCSTKIAATSDGQSTASCTVKVSRKITITSDGQSTASCTVKVSRKIALTSDGQSTASCSATVFVFVEATAAGQSTAVIAAKVLRKIIITSDGQSTTAVGIKVLRKIALTSGGQSTAAVTVIVIYAEIPPFMEKDLIDPYASGAWLWLVQIAIAGQSTVRIARNTGDIRYKGNDFDKFNLQIGEQLFSGDGSIPKVTLKVFQDINRVVEDLINETEGALGAQVKLIRVNEKFLTSPVNALEFDYDNLASESDTEWCTFTLGIPNPLTQRFPLRIYSSSTCPWATPTLYKGPRCQCVHADTTCTGTYEDCYGKENAVHWGAELGLDPNTVKV